MIALWIVASLVVGGYAKDETSRHWPKAVIIGDSISNVYTHYVQTDLKGKASVSHACGKIKHGNCNNGQTWTILDNMHYYFVDGDPDIITYNSGVHDFSSYPGTAPHTPCSERSLRTPPEKYFQNMNAIADYLQKHGRIVIWIDTTTIVAKNSCANEKLREQYNGLAE